MSDEEIKELIADLESTRDRERRLRDAAEKLFSIPRDGSWILLTVHVEALREVLDETI